MTWELSLSGLLIGVLVGLTGMGGGSLMTPLLVLVFGFKPAVAIGTDILHGAIFKTFGAFRHRRLGNVQARLSGWMFLGSAPMSLAGVALATWIARRYGDGIESLQSQILGAALIFGSAGIILKMLMRPAPTPAGRFILRNRDRVVAVLIGVVGGFVVGLTSVGTGTFFGLTMLMAFPLRSVKVIGTDIFHAAALLWVAGLGHLAVGNVDGTAVGWLLIGSIPGVLIGSQLTMHIADGTLRGALAGVLLLSGGKLAGLSTPGLIALVAVGCAATVAAWSRERRNGALAPVRDLPTADGEVEKAEPERAAGRSRP